MPERQNTPVGRCRHGKVPGRLAALGVTVAALVVSGCGSTRAQDAVASAIAKTEAAGSAHFAIGSNRGEVDFADGELEMVRYRAGGPPPGRGRVYMKVVEVGYMAFSRLYVPLLDKEGWTAQRVPRRLNDLQFPLQLHLGSQVRAEGRTTILGTATTQYAVRMPGGTAYGVRVLPYSLHLWLDGSGRIRKASQTVVETGLPGSAEPKRFSSSIVFSDFGAPVHIRVPEHYRLRVAVPPGPPEADERGSGTS